MKAVLVVGHGSRSEESRAQFFKIVDSLKTRLDITDVEGSFMDLSKPSIEDQMDLMYKRGIRSFVILPYFLGPGIHIKRDIPEILKAQKLKHKDISISIGEAIGYHDKLIDILKERVEGKMTSI